MKKVALIGIGLMGASLGLALKKRAGVRVSGYARRQETRTAALAGGICDEVFADPSEAVKGADMVVMCLPVLAMGPMAGAFADALEEGCVVTDVGSTKELVCSEMSKMLAGSRGTFVGSHPMAGSDETGLEAGRADLYESALVIVTTGHGEDQRHVERVKNLWISVGAAVSEMSPAEHDRMIARTSHLPHLAASVLVLSVLGKEAQASRFCGSGFKDTTRVAGGSEDIWHDIVKSNSRAVLDELNEFSAILDRMKKLIEEGGFEEVRKLLAEARKLRRGLAGGRSR